MFLVRTQTSVHGTSNAALALAHVRQMQQAGRRVVITNVSGRNLSAADLQREITAAQAPVRH